MEKPREEKMSFFELVEETRLLLKYLLDDLVSVGVSADLPSFYPYKEVLADLSDLDNFTLSPAFADNCDLMKKSLYEDLRDLGLTTSTDPRFKQRVFDIAGRFNELKPLFIELQKRFEVAVKLFWQNIDSLEEGVEARFPSEMRLETDLREMKIERNQARIYIKWLIAMVVAGVIGTGFTCEYMHKQNKQQDNAVLIRKQQDQCNGKINRIISHNLRDRGELKRIIKEIR